MIYSYQLIEGDREFEMEGSFIPVEDFSLSDCLFVIEQNLQAQLKIGQCIKNLHIDGTKIFTDLYYVRPTELDLGEARKLL